MKAVKCLANQVLDERTGGEVTTPVVIMEALFEELRVDKEVPSVCTDAPLLGVEVVHIILCRHVLPVECLVKHPDRLLLDLV